MMTLEDKLKKDMEFKRGMSSLALAPVKSDEYISPLNDAKTLVKGSAPVPEAKTIIKGVTDKIDTMTPMGVVKGVTDKIDTKSIQKIGNAEAVAEKIRAIIASRAAAKMGENTLKSIPVIGGLVGMGSSLMSGDVAAAGLDAADVVADVAMAPTNPVGLATTAIDAFSGGDLGSESDSLEHKMESGTATPDELYRLRNGMK